MKLKNYKNLVPVVLIFFMFLASYKLVSTAREKEKEYFGYLEAAREKAEQGILVDSLENYKQAIAMHPVLELYVETGEMIETLGTYKQRITWGERVINDYPDEAQGYAYLIRTYLEKEKYASCFEINATVVKKGIISQEIQEMMEQILYEYELDFNMYGNIGAWGDYYCAVFDNENGCWGYVNTYGSLVVPFQYSKAGVFADNLVSVVDAEGSLYFINADNEKKLAVYDEEDMEVVGIINEDRYPVKIGNEYYYCNADGELVLGPYAKASSYNFGKAAVLLEEGWTFIDTEGNILTENTYLNVMLDKKCIAFRNGRAFVETDQGILMIDENFLPVGEEVYDAAVPFYDTSYAAVEKDGKWGFIDNMGNISVSFDYDEADSFSNGLAAVRDEEKWGYINQKGEMAIAPCFEGAAPFTADGTAFVKIGDYFKLLKLIQYNW